MNIIYEGVDITQRVSVQKYTHESYAEQHADILKIKFNDSAALWDKWSPKEGDTIEMSEGYEKTGTMYVRDCIAESNYYTITAYSYPAEMEQIREQRWNNISLKALGNDIAKRYDFEFLSFGVTDHTFLNLHQCNLSDLDFFEKLAVLCGCAFIMYNKQMILYSEEYLESQTVKETASIDGANRFKFKKKPTYTGCTVTDGTISYTFGQKDRIITEKLDVVLASRGEAQLFAKNLLKFKNKFHKSGYFYINSKELTAGSIINISSPSVTSFSGKIFIYKIRYGTSHTKVFFRAI